MAFKTSAVSTTTNNSDRPQVDFDALNEFVVEQVGCQQPETLNGVLTGIIDLGNQKLPDAEYDVDSGDESLTVEELTEKYSADIESGKVSKFDIVKDWSTRPPKEVIKKIVKQKPQQCVTYIVDFPDILVDKAKFFGDESKPLPLRLYAGGNFFNTYQKKELIQNPMPLKWSNINSDKSGKPIFSLALTSQLHKMAVASNIVKTGEAFEPHRVDELLGKTLQFKVQVGRNDKGYYFEKLSFVGAIQKKDKPFENVQTFMVQFGEENDVEVLKHLRRHVYNTMSNALNFSGDIIEKQAMEVKPQFFKDTTGSPSVVKKEVVGKEVVSKSTDEDDSDDWS